MNRFNKWSLLILAIVVLAGGTSLYIYQRPENIEKKPAIVYIPKTEDGTNDFWTSLIAGTRMAAKEYDVELEIQSPKREQDVEVQVQILQDAVNKQPDAILISPSSYTGETKLLKEAKKNGISVVCVDSVVEEKVQDFTVSTDNLEAGRILGKYVHSLLGETDQIAVVGHVKGVSTAMERERGFLEGLGEKSLNVVDIVYCNSEYEKAYQLANELMEKYPDLKMIAGLNEYSFVGAARAVKDADAQKHIQIVGIDSSLEAVDMMEQGIVDGFVVQKAFKMGYTAVRETVSLLNGKKVPEEIDSGSELVTPDNMYDSEIEKLIFPFDSVRQ